MTLAKDLPGISEAYFSTEPGPYLLSFRSTDVESYSVATFTKRSFATLITLTFDDEDAPRLSQYLLPIGHLHGASLGAEPLRTVLQISQATRVFRFRRILKTHAPQIASGQSAFGTVFDPIGRTMAAPR